MPSSDHRSPLLDAVNKRLAKTSVHAPDGTWPPPGRSVTDAFADVAYLVDALGKLKATGTIPQVPTPRNCAELDAIVRAVLAIGWPDSPAYKSNWPGADGNGLNAQQLLSRQAWEIGQVAADMCNAIAISGGGGGDKR